MRIFDLSVFVIMDDVDEVPGGYAIRSHDLHGPLPTVTIPDTGGSFEDNKAAATEVCRLTCVVRVGEQRLAEFPRARLLPPTIMGDRQIVGIRVGKKTFLGQATMIWEARPDVLRRVRLLWFGWGGVPRHEDARLSYPFLSPKPYESPSPENVSGVRGVLRGRKSPLLFSRLAAWHGR